MYVHTLTQKHTHICIKVKPLKIDPVVYKNVFQEHFEVDGRILIWHKQHEGVAPSCLVSTIKPGCDAKVV